MNARLKMGEHQEKLVREGNEIRNIKEQLMQKQVSKTDDEIARQKVDKKMKAQQELSVFFEIHDQSKLDAAVKKKNEEAKILSTFNKIRDDELSQSLKKKIEARNQAKELQLTHLAQIVILRLTVVPKNRAQE